MKYIAPLFLLLFLQACFTIRVYETPNSTVAKKPSKGLTIVRSGEQVDFGSHQSDVYFFRDDHSPKGVWHEDPKPTFESADTVMVQEMKKPLILIDGQSMPKTFPLDAIKPEHIENVSVLKDSFAVAKYGKEGQNGVIEILLKKTPQ